MHLFVYGTLRASADHPMHAVLRAVASPVGSARIRGRLYLVAHYPGLVLDERAGWVRGELYEMRDPRGLEPIDEYEGASPRDPEPREYRRVLRTVHLDPRNRRMAWLYEYRHWTGTERLIPSGDFLSGDLLDLDR